MSTASPTFNLRLSNEISWLELVYFNSLSRSAENMEALKELAVTSPSNPITPNLDTIIEKVKNFAEKSIFDPTIAKEAVALLHSNFPTIRVQISPQPRVFTPVFSSPPNLRRTVSPFFPIREKTMTEEI